MKIATIVGARPQFVKASVVSMEIANCADIEEVIVHTGQHFDKRMSGIFFDEMEIPEPDYNLEINSLSHGAMTGRQLEKIEEVLVMEKPDWVLVYGDTNSTLAGALAAVKLHIPVAHVEAGLRSFNRRMPEEINRVLTDHVAELLFVPTKTSVRNLEKEGISGEKVQIVGDVMYDAALYFGEKAERASRILEKLNLQTKGYILATIHRQENTDAAARLKSIIRGMEQAPFPVIIPLHPRTRKLLELHAITLNLPIRPVEPVGYLDMLMLERNAAIIATDSGGVQKEALFFGIPCVVLREETEWVEAVESGRNILVGADSDLIRDALCKPNVGRDTYENVFGDGSASEKIVKTLRKNVVR